MMQNLQLTETSKSLKRLNHPPEPPSQRGLASCLIQRTTVLFDILHLNGKDAAQSFLVMDPGQWSDDLSYQDFRRAASTMTVVNERVIALMQKYNGSLTKNKEQKQFLL